MLLLFAIYLFIICIYHNKDIRLCLVIHKAQVH